MLVNLIISERSFFFVVVDSENSDSLTAGAEVGVGGNWKEESKKSSISLMASASLGNGNGNGGVGSSRSAFRGSSSSVDWLGREMLEMRLRDKVDHDDDDRAVTSSTHSFFKIIKSI